MHSITDEMNLIVKPEQSGKTFIMIQEMIKAYTAEEGLDGKKVVNFIFCDNSLLLTKQTSKRVEKDLTTYIAEGKTYVELSSRKGNETRNWDAAYGVICDGVVNIICCTNGKRVNDISKIVNRINASPHLEGFTFKVWLDEADKFEKHITKTFLPLSKECDNVEIWLMTATPKNLFKKFNLNIFPMEKTTQPDYHGWNDNCIVKLEDPFGSTGEFISEVLSSNHQLIQPGTKWYIPAEKTKNSHRDVAMRCIYHQMAVFIVNGDGLTLQRPGMASITEEKKTELNPHIRSMYAEHGLDKYAVAITGHLCVSRGISIMSKEFIFDYGILSSCKQKAEASQSAGRLKGNIKGWANYKPPMVFTTEKFDANATEWEAVSRRLAELAHERKVAGETTVMTNTDFKTEFNKAMGVLDRHKRVPMMFDNFPIDLYKTQNTTHGRTSVITDFIKTQLNDVATATNLEFIDIISNTDCFQRSTPGEGEETRTRNLDWIRSAAETNSIRAIKDAAPKYRTISCWQAYIDDIEKRVYILWQKVA
jgi:hypothetical protein